MICDARVRLICIHVGKVDGRKKSERDPTVGKVPSVGAYSSLDRYSTENSTGGALSFTAARRSDMR
jgi:hypothetical protein